jgi:hypothetical protein
MISNSFLNCNPKTRSEMTWLFIAASIAYLNNLDWKLTFRKAKVSAKGAKLRFCEFWLNKTDSDIAYAIDKFLESI